MHPIIIGIAGPSASGKSLLATTIVNEIGSDQVIVIPEDFYYKSHANLSFEERANLNFDHPDSLDHNLLYEHLLKLKQGETVQVPIYDYSQHLRRQETRTVGKHTILVLEGILLFFDPLLREVMNMRIFMDTPLDMCLIRRIKRDVVERQRTFDSVLEQYKETVRPMYTQFIEPCKRYAHLIVPHGGANRIAIDIIKAKMKELLEANGVK